MVFPKTILSIVVFLSANLALGESVILFHDKYKSPDFREIFKKFGLDAKESIGIQMVPKGFPVTDIYKETLRSALRTKKKSPDMFTWWTTYRAQNLIEANLVEDLTAEWDSVKDEVSNDIRKVFTAKNGVYGVPFYIDYWPVFYNKKVFIQHKIKPPKTWNELVEIGKILRKNSITPMLSTVIDGWTPFIHFGNIS